MSLVSLGECVCPMGIASTALHSVVPADTARTHVQFLSIGQLYQNTSNVAQVLSRIRTVPQLSMYLYVCYIHVQTCVEPALSVHQAILGSKASHFVHRCSCRKALQALEI